MKQKGLRAVSGLQGVESISLDMKDQKLTVIGDINPVDLVSKLRKLCFTEIVSVGPAKEEKKKEKEEPKKDKEKEPEKEEPKKEKEMAELVKAYQAYNPYMTPDYFVRSVDEDPKSCAIC